MADQLQPPVEIAAPSIPFTVWPSASSASSRLTPESAHQSLNELLKPCVTASTPFSFNNFEVAVFDRGLPVGLGNSSPDVSAYSRASSSTALGVSEVAACPGGGLVTDEADCTSPGRQARLTAAVMLAVPDVTVTSDQVAFAAAVPLA